MLNYHIKGHVQLPLNHVHGDFVDINEFSFISKGTQASRHNHSIGDNIGKSLLMSFWAFGGCLRNIIKNKDL